MSAPLRILHFSDIHLSLSIRHMPWQKWFSKRAIGALNLMRGRAKYFRQVEHKINALAQFAKEQKIDLVLNSGDYTALGLDVELAMAYRLVQPLMNHAEGYITVPGNHDLYVNDQSWRRFCRQFSEVLRSDWPEYCAAGDHWPQIRLIRDHLAVISVNSARPSPYWASYGQIDKVQLNALRRLLADPRLKDRYVFILTHYAPRLANGQKDKKSHGLKNADQLLEICRPLPQAAILCGHVHHTYHIVLPEGPNGGIYCAGSATMERREGLWLYELDGLNLKAYPVIWQHRFKMADIENK